MEYFWAVLLSLCLVTSFIGFIMLFIRGRRKKGALLLFSGFFASIFAALFMSFSIDIEKGASGAQSATSARDSIEGFPDAETKERASALGISRYAAFQLLEDEITIRSYCEYAAITDGVIVAKYDAIDAGGDEEALAKTTDVELEKELNAFNQKTGLEGDEVSYLAIAGHWDLYCRAYENGWGILTADQAMDLDKETARLARDAIELIYIDRLKNGSESSFFTVGNFDAVDCDLMRNLIDDMSFVWCQLVGLGNETPWHIYLIGRDGDQLMFYPVNGKTAQSVEIFWPEVPAERRANISLAGYVSGILPVSDIVSAFD